MTGSITKKILIASTLAGFIALSSCAGRKTQPDQQEQNRQQAVDPKFTPQAMNARLDDLEAKIAAMNDKLNSTRQTMDSFTSLHDPHGSGIPMQASDTVGIAVTPPPLPGAASGFVNDDAVHQYRKASILLETQEYPNAITAFSAFLGSYPDNPLAGSAQYHIGEAYFRQKQYARADRELGKVLTSYDRSPHISDTLRLMAAAEDSIGKPEAAARHRQMLTSLFAGSPAAARVSEDRAQAQVPVQQAEVQPVQPQQQAQQPARQDDSGIPENPVTPLAKPGLDGPPPTANMTP